MRALYRFSIGLPSTSSNEKFSGYDRKRRFTEPNGMIRSCIFSNICHICSIRPRISIHFSTSDSEYSKVTTRINTNSFLVRDSQHLRSKMHGHSDTNGNSYFLEQKFWKSFSFLLQDRNLMELGDNISESELDDVIREIPLDDDVRNSIDDAITYGSLHDELTNTMDEYKHRR